jgi:hypothetical protein
MDPGSSSLDAMALDNFTDPVEVDYLFQRNWLELMAICASHPKLGSTIHIGEAGDVSLVVGYSPFLFHSTTFQISNRKQ